MGIIIKKIILHRLKMQLNHPFVTSFGFVEEKDFFIAEMMDDQGNRGYGESVAFTNPWYTEETVETTKHMIEDVLIPILKQSKIEQPRDVTELFRVVKQNNMAKATLETAVWDLYAKQKQLPLYELLQQFSNDRKLRKFKQTIDVGVSLGIEKNIEDLFAKIEHYMGLGYKRVKVKIMPGHDINIVERVRIRFPTLNMFVDANGAYTLDDITVLKQLDAYDLMMIEQPFGENAFIEHAELQKEIQTPICLDESIHCLADVKIALKLGSCKIVNIKLGRVGGITEALKIHQFCLNNNVPVWAGGMLEAGVGRAHNIALATLNNFTIPGDIAGSSHYFKQDIIRPEVVVENGTISLPNKHGIGYEINEQLLRQFTISKDIYSF